MKGLLQGVAPEPSPDAVLWRYMSFSKFVAMLSQGGLYFRRSDAFADKWEAAIGPASLKPLYDRRLSEMMSEIVSSPPPAGEEPLDEESKANLANDLMRQLSELNRKLRLNTFISCWHEAEHESEAMWKLYSFDSSEGIAIITDCRTLKRLLPRKYPMAIGTVRYRNSDLGPSGPFHRFFHKRPAFSHEREVRLLHLREDVEPDENLGLVIPIDLRKLIQQVIVSPYAPDWVAKAAEDVCRRFRMKIDVTRSQLSEEPFHY